MEVILSHQNLDFDGLASMVGAQKLHPEARIVLPNTTNHQVSQYLAIYKDYFQLYETKQIEWEKVEHVILVDCSSLSRLGQVARHLLKKDISFTVYDHHPLSTDHVTTQHTLIEPVGATITLLIELINKRKLDVSSLEATLFALGIYTDTGHFKHLTTSYRDLLATAHLLKQGAQLTFIHQFADQSLNVHHQTILNHLLTNIHSYHRQGIDFIITWHQYPQYVRGLSMIAKNMMNITGTDVLFMVVEMDDKIHILARSTTERVDVRPYIQQWGGDGHTKAATATLKGESLDHILNKLEEDLATFVQPAITAREIMTSPVLTVSPSMSINEAIEQMKENGYSGFPVEDEKNIVGMISRRDANKALQHNLGHAPVKGYMSRNVISTTSEAPLEKVQSLIIEHHIGRIPVIDDGGLVGIITRTDVIRHLHERHERAINIRTEG